MIGDISEVQLMSFSRKLESKFNTKPIWPLLRPQPEQGLINPCFSMLQTKKYTTLFTKQQLYFVSFKTN